MLAGSLIDDMQHMLRRTTVIGALVTLQSIVTTASAYEEALAELEAWQAQRSARVAEFAAVEVRLALAVLFMVDRCSVASRGRVQERRQALVLHDSARRSAFSVGP